MNMWIKLHYRYDGKPVMVQTKNITNYGESTNNNCSTDVFFIGNDENYITVKETIEEIENMITEDW